ncbi:MAG: adenylate cyclase, partial [Thermoleophilaceae bacterium]|nr:adenylate cyclase [Thermoleophilaceae bacterium]
LDGSVSPGRFHNKLVVIGLTARDTDRHRTPLGGDQRMSGPEIQANALDTIMRGASLRDVSRLVDAVIILLLGLVPVAAARLRSPARAAAVVLTTAVLFVAAVQAAFSAGWIVAVVVPLAALAAASAAVLVVGLLRRSRIARRPDSERAPGVGRAGI